MGINVGIKIYDLYPNRDIQFLKTINPVEMRNIKGGFAPVRRNRNPTTTTTTIDNSEISALMEDINQNLYRLRMDVNSTLEELRQSLRFS